MACIPGPFLVDETTTAATDIWFYTYEQETGVRMQEKQDTGVVDNIFTNLVDKSGKTPGEKVNEAMEHMIAAIKQNPQKPNRAKKKTDRSKSKRARKARRKNRK